MSRWIDAEWLMNFFVDIPDNFTLTIGNLRATVNDAPTIDAVSVVRCKECKHKYQEPWNNGVAVEGECEIWHRATLADDFCSYGERKESE